MASKTTPTPTCHVPTRREVSAMAEAVFDVLGGPRGAAEKLSWPSFYALAYLVAMNTSGGVGDILITGASSHVPR